MFIDTHTKGNMKESLEEVLGTKKNAIESILNDELLIERSIDQIISSGKIDSFLFFHFSRRLRTATASKDGLCLFDLLLTDNAFSRFLKAYGITFLRKDEHIILFFQGKEQDLKKHNVPCADRLRCRLGQVKIRQDTCFNGFAIREGLTKNDYFGYLSDVPELIKDICTLLGIKRLGQDYWKNSDYYCFEYKVPVKFVIFDDLGDSATERDKIHFFLNSIYKRLRMHVECGFDNHDDDNLIIRLPDQMNMRQEWFASKEAINIS